MACSEATVPSFRPEIRAESRAMLLCAVGLVACGKSPSADIPTPDAGTAAADLGFQTDASSPDAGPRLDTGALQDAGRPSIDAGGPNTPDPATARFAPPELGDWTGDLELPSARPLPPGLAGFDGLHHSALSCGPHPQNIAELFIPSGVDRPPLLFYIHGGGFTGGSRLAILQGQAPIPSTYLGQGFAFATVDYRFRENGGVRTPLQDVQVCLQFMRMHADALGFDPERIILAGGSAGAGTSLWIATHDDLAEPNHPHPVLRQSTEVLGIIISGPQSTYDILAWPQVFLPEYPNAFDAVDTAELLDFYDVQQESELHEEPYLSYRAAAHMLPKFDANDPPIWVLAQGNDIDPAQGGDHLHHPFHARAIINTAMEAGIEVIANVPALGLNAEESNLAFAARLADLP